MRRAYIDWLRGLAVVIMMEWHAVDAWAAADARTTEGFRVAALIGGWAAPLFLFLAGVAVPLAGAAKIRKSGLDRRAASRALQIRGWQVFALAHLFRFQSFLFDLSASWGSIFKPDILNILGLGLVAAAFSWGRATTPRRRVLYLLVPAAIVVLLAPWSVLWSWPTLLPPRLEAYIEESMGVQDIIAQGFEPDTVRRVVRMIDGAEYKRRQGPIGVKITPRAFGRDWRLPIVNRFRVK